MGWIDKVKQHGTEKAKPRQRKPRPIVQETWAQVRTQSEDGSDPGEVAPVYFTVEDGVLTMTDAKGKPLENVEPYTLSAGQDPASFARVLGRPAQKENDFNRPLHYPPHGGRV